MVTARLIRANSSRANPNNKSSFASWEDLLDVKSKYADDLKRQRARTYDTSARNGPLSPHGGRRQRYHRSLSESTTKTDGTTRTWDDNSTVASPTGSAVMAYHSTSFVSGGDSFYNRRGHRDKEGLSAVGRRGSHVLFQRSRAGSLSSEAGGISTDDGVSQKFSEEFDRTLFLHMAHPLDGKDGNVANNLETLWQIQYALKDLRRYLRSRGDQKLWDYIPCKDPTSVSVERVFAWLQSLKYSLKMAPKKAPPTFTVVKNSRKELGAFVKGMTPDMIDRVIKYVDRDGNGEIDIAELDLAFRLSRIEIDECIEMPEADDLDASSIDATRSSASISSPTNNNNNNNHMTSGVTLGVRGDATVRSLDNSTLPTMSINVASSSASVSSNLTAGSPTAAGTVNTTTTTIGTSSVTAGGTTTSTMASSDDYTFFLDNDVLTLLALMQFDVYHMCDIKKAVRRIRKLKHLKTGVDRKTAKISAYFDLICERLNDRSLHPRQWILQEFDEQLLLVPLSDIRAVLVRLLRGHVPSAFFGADYNLFEAHLEDASGRKGHVNVNILESQLEEALTNLRVVLLSGTLRRPNDDTASVREALERIESVVYGRYYLRLPEYLKFLDTERTGRLTQFKIRDALFKLSRAPPLNLVAQKLVMEKRAKIREQETDRRRKDRHFHNKLIVMKKLGVTEVLRKFERFIRERGMRLQDFFNLVDEDRSGRLTPDELMQALLLFANRPENPQRLHERRRREAAQNRTDAETRVVEDDHKVFMRQMRELENMGAHSALLKMTKYMRRYQRTFEMIFGDLDEYGDEYVISQEEIIRHFHQALVTRAEAERLYDYCRGRITVSRIEEMARKYARYRRMLKHNTMRTEEDAGLPLFSFDKIMMILRFFFWQEVSVMDYPDADLRISLIEFQTAIDNEERRHVISYANEFRARRFHYRPEMTEDTMLHNLLSTASITSSSTIGDTLLTSHSMFF